MQKISLLRPNDSGKCFPVSEITANDLGLSFIAEQITETKEEQRIIRDILLNMPVSADIVRYRKEVYSELSSDTALCKELLNICDSLRFSFNDRPIQIGRQSTIWELIQRFRALEHYIRSVLRLRDLFADRQFQSDGMIQFSAFVTEITTDSGFDALLEDMSVLDDDVYSIHSITLGAPTMRVGRLHRKPNARE